MTSVFSELKRRNVIRMAGLYLIGAWLVTQVAGTLLPMFDAPPWVARTIVILLAIGFVPTLVFSWIYELTPDGLKRDRQVPPEQSIAQQTGRRIDFAIIAVLLVAVVYFAVDRFVFEPRRITQARSEASQPQPHDATELISQPMFAPIRNDPRWLPFLRKYGRAPEQLAAIPFNVTLPP